LYLRNDKEYRHISNTKNKGGYLPCAAVPFILAYLSSAVYRVGQSITGTIGGAENDGHEIAGHEIDGPSCRA